MMEFKHHRVLPIVVGNIRPFEILPAILVLFLLFQDEDRRSDLVQID
jgi:hypothetical protein